MTLEEIEAAFTRSDGEFLFARWGRPIASVVFGVEEETLKVVKGAIEAFSVLTGHPLAETDPELGTNLMIFFVREWAELDETPGLDRLIPDLFRLTQKLRAVDANQYRIFRFDQDGAIRACFVFVRMDTEMQSVPAAAIALAQVVQSTLLWSDEMFSASGPLVKKDDTLLLRPDVADLMRVSYDAALPTVARDSSFALRLFARLQRPT